jgi:S-methylmethionine-dependent homocysteine/selenocysteine methylase
MPADRSAGVSALERVRRLRDQDRLVVIDGGMGSELEARGAKMDHWAWSGLVNLEDPELVRRVHEDYLRAGADVLITNTFMSGTGPLERAGQPGRFDEANRNAVRAARDAVAAAADRPIVIAGSVSVTEVGAPEAGAAEGPERHRRLADGYRRQVELLADAGVDLVALEMVDHPRYAEPAVQAAVEVGLPVWLGLCVHAHPADREAGMTATVTNDHRQVVRLAEGPAFDAVCVMHTNVDDVAQALALVGESWDGPVGAYPHHGIWERPNWRFLDLPTERFVKLAEEWRASGVGMIGGCCGIGPAHIEALSRLS